TDAVLNDPAAAHAALTAFLRGVERRGAVLAHWQGGNAGAGDAALAATLRDFQAVAAATAFAPWPRRFWAMLLAAPQPRDRSGEADPGLPPAVAALGTGPRAVLLLRLVAGLAEADAAAVLGIGRSSYRLALQRALPRREDGSPDTAAWQALSAAAREAVRTVPEERLARIRMLRDGARLPAATPGRARGPGQRRGWLWPATLLAVAAVAAALAATWWGPWLPPAAPGPGNGIRSEPLPAADPPPRSPPIATWSCCWTPWPATSGPTPIPRSRPGWCRRWRRSRGSCPRATARRAPLRRAPMVPEWRCRLAAALALLLAVGNVVA